MPISEQNLFTSFKPEKLSFDHFLCSVIQDAIQN